MQQKVCEKCGGTGIRFDFEALKLKRLRKGKSQIFVAKRMGVTTAYLCDLEHGRRDWNADLVSLFNFALK